MDSELHTNHDFILNRSVQSRHMTVLCRNTVTCVIYSDWLQLRKLRMSTVINSSKTVSLFQILDTRL
jgi:hypothetical protein